MTSHISTTSRRGMLAVLGAGAAFVAAPAIATSAKPSDERAAWLAALETYRRSRAAADAHNDQIWEPARDACEAAEERIPHRTIVVGSRRYSTENEFQVRSARQQVAGARYIETCAYEDHKAAQLLTDAAETRERAKKRLRARFRVDELWEEGEQLERVSNEAFKAIHYVPAYSATMLAEKWAWILDKGDLEGWEDAITLDLARLAARERN